MICPDCSGKGAVPGERKFMRCRTCDLRGVVEAQEPDPPVYGYCKCGELVERNELGEHYAMCEAR